MTTRILSTLLFLLTLACVTATAQVASSVDPAKADSIRELSRITGQANMAKQVMGQMVEQFKTMMPDVPASAWTEMMADENVDELMALVIPIYDRNFTQEDINGLLAFYRSDLGQRVLAKMPVVLQESMLAGQEWGAAVGQRIMERLKKKGYRKS
jgi:uncharacterized protein